MLIKDVWGLATVYTIEAATAMAGKYSPGRGYWQ
jgi:hypothetical protein